VQVDREQLNETEEVREREGEKDRSDYREGAS
jgi:hypothetical protein